MGGAHTVMIRVIRSGLLTSLQDLGRLGYQKYGVIVSGAMDDYAHRVANLLVGNPVEEATLEMTLLGPTLEFQVDALISICGGDLQPRVNGRHVPQWASLMLKKGSILEFASARVGCRAYLAVCGGYDVSAVMGSKSTYLRANIGGFQGRALQDGDYLVCNPTRQRSCVQAAPESISTGWGACDNISHPWSVGWRARTGVAPSAMIRVLPGPEYEAFTELSRTRLFSEAFQVSVQSDRMGYRLVGPVMEYQGHREMISEGVTVGTVQVPSDGNPILLMSDRQTMGGYPRIAQVATVDIATLAQVKPGDAIRFTEVSLLDAQELLRQRARLLRYLAAAIACRDKEGGWTYAPDRFEL